METAWLIYVTSGTGNSLRVAHHVAARLEQAGTGHAQVVPIEQAQVDAEFRPGTEQILGLVAPTHGFATPWHMLRFTCALPRGGCNRAFVIINRAALRFGRITVPGVGGTNLFLLALVLWLKGFVVRWVTAVDMPSNWYSLHAIQSTGKQRLITARAERMLEPLLERLRSGRAYWLSWWTLYEAAFAVPLAPLALLYLFRGRFFLAKLFFANSRCDGCGICATACPVSAIKMWGKACPLPYWRFTCESCMRCAALCPGKAVEAGHSWAMILFVISGLPGSIYALIRLRATPAWARWLDHELLELAFSAVVAFALLFLSYVAFYALGRLRFVNWLFAKTTLTHYWGRYREMETPKRELGLRKPVTRRGEGSIPSTRAHR